METTTLDTVFATGGIPHISFWNGRVLTAADLRDEQLANHLGRRLLGRALGDGVVTGLFVRPGPTGTQVEVGAGIAIDRLGQAMELSVDVTVSLVVPPETASGDGLFVVCDPRPSATPTGSGLYLLVARPASSSQSSAPGVPVNGNGVATECGPRYSVDGLSFRLIGLDISALTSAATDDAADIATVATLGSAFQDDRVRNVIAHVLLDSVWWGDTMADPFIPPPRTDAGALESLRDDPLAPCEVPLALVTWTSTGVGLVDVWSVRRSPSPAPAEARVDNVAGGGRRAIGRSTFSQFQDHLTSIAERLNSLQRQSFELASRFRYLPAAGLVPIDGPGRTGFSEADVFGNLVLRGPVTLPSAAVGPLLDESYGHRPIDVDGGEVVYAYRVDDSGSGAADYVVFCTSRMEFLGDELRIDAVFPGGLTVLGQQIEIRGRAFAFSTGDARVSFDGVASDPLPGSSDTRLLVAVPLNLAVAADGTEIVLEVTNGVDTDSVPVMIGHPAQPVAGDLHVRWVRTAPPTLERGQPGDLVYTVTSALNQDADVVLTYGGPPGGVLVDETDTPITDVVRIDQGATIDVRVVFAAIPDVAEFEATVIAVSGAVTGDNFRTFQTGTPTPEPDPAIELSVDNFAPQGGGVGSMVGTTISLGPGVLADITINASLSAAGDYDVRVEPTDLTGPWQSVLSEPADGRWEAVTLGSGGEPGDRAARFTVGRNGSDPPATVDFVVQRVGRTDEARITFTLQVQ